MHLKRAMDIDAKIDRVQLQDGDILVVRIVDKTIRHDQMRLFRKYLHGIVDRLGVKAEVLVIGPADVDIEIAKRSELADIYQRLDDIEDKLHLL